MRRSSIVALGALIVLVTAFTSWYPFLAIMFMFENIVYIVYIFTISSIVSIMLSLVIYKSRRLASLLNTLLALALIVMCILGTVLDSTWIQLLSLSLLLASTSYLGKSYSLAVRYSSRIPSPLKPKIIEHVTSRSWIYGFIGCLLFSFIASRLSVKAFVYGLSIVVAVLLLVPIVILKPNIIVSIDGKGAVIGSTIRRYAVLVAYVCLVVFALNIYYPFLPAYVKEYVGLSIIGVGLFYASVTVLSRVMFSVAQIVIAVKDPITSFTVRSLLSGLLLLTASSSENPWFTLILLTVALSSTPLHTLAYSVFARKMGIKLTIVLELVYTIIGVPAVFFGYSLWSKSPVLMLATSAVLLLASTVLTGYLKRRRNTMLSEGGVG